MARDFEELNNVRLIWTNFAGNVSQFNMKGNRVFNVVLDEDDAERLLAKGLNVKVHPSKNPDEPPIRTLQCFVSFSPYPPEDLYRITSNGKIRLNEDTIGNLDHEDINHANVKLNLSHWTMPDGRTGIKPYVNKLAVWVNEDHFADSYSNIPDIGGPEFNTCEDLLNNDFPF